MYGNKLGLSCAKLRLSLFWIGNVEFDGFESFCEAVVQVVGEVGRRCGEITFVRSSVCEQVVGLGERLGWKVVKDEKGFLVDAIVIRKK